MTKPRKNQREKPAREDVVKTFDKTTADPFERDAEEIYARQVKNYEQAQAEGVELEEPSIEAIKEALSLHSVPQVRTDTQKVEDFCREAHCALADLLKLAKGGSSKPYALDTLVALLDHSCAELQRLAERPPRGVSEAVKKVLAGRVRLPLNIGSKDVEIERIKRLLKRYRVGLPHRLKVGRTFELQKFAATLISETKALRAHIERHGPSNDDEFEQQLARLSPVPDKRWCTLLRKAPKHFYGSNWFATEEHCVRWAEPWTKSPKKRITEHRAKGLRNSLAGRGHREAKLKERAMNELSKCFGVLVKGDFA
jgi:hypothetical protein